MTHKMFDALPAYLGGKRKLVNAIFASLAELIPMAEWPGLRLLDAFLGGGAVSLYAKAHGFEVQCNDLAARSAIVGRALIAKGETRLSRHDIRALFTHAPDDIRVASAIRIFSPQQREFLARALAAASACDEPKRSLLLLVLPAGVTVTVSFDANFGFGGGVTGNMELIMSVDASETDPTTTSAAETTSISVAVQDGTAIAILQ